MNGQKAYYKSPEEIDNMTPEEFRAFYDAVMREVAKEKEEQARIYREIRESYDRVEQLNSELIRDGKQPLYTPNNFIFKH